MEDHCCPAPAHGDGDPVVRVVRKCKQDYCARKGQIESVLSGVCKSFSSSEIQSTNVYRLMAIQCSISQRCIFNFEMTLADLLYRPVVIN